MSILDLYQFMKDVYEGDCEMNFRYQVPTDDYLDGEYNMLRIVEKYINNSIDKMAKEEENDK